MLDYEAIGFQLRQLAKVNHWDVLPELNWYFSAANVSARIIYVPELTHILSLAIHAHECGHVALQHPHVGMNIHQEMLAWRWAYHQLWLMKALIPHVDLYARRCIQGYNFNGFYSNESKRFASNVPALTRNFIDLLTSFMEIENTNPQEKVEAEGVPALFFSTTTEAIECFQQLFKSGKRRIQRSVLTGTQWQCVEFTP